MTICINEIRRQYECTPTDLSAILNYARCLVSREESEEAVRVLDLAKLNSSIEAQILLASAKCAVLGPNAALDVLSRATSLHPTGTILHEEFGRYLAEMGRWSDSLRSFGQALRYGQSKRGVFGLARAAIRARGGGKEVLKILEHYMDRRRAQSVLAYVLAVEGSIQQAQDLLQGKTDDVYWNILARAHVANAIGEARDAECLIRLAVQTYPSENEAATLLLMHMLGRGEIDSARDVYSRYTAKVQRSWGHGNRCRGVAPKWKGEPIEGKRILLYCPMGFGDSFMFARYVRYFSDRGASVVLECRRSASAVLISCPGVDQTIERYDSIAQIDFEADLREVFLIASEPLEAIGYESPYLLGAASHSRQIKLGNRGPRHRKRRIGLVWSSTTGNGGEGPWTCKSLPLMKLVEVIDSSSIGVALQFVTEGLPDCIIRPKRRIETFLDTARIIEQVDVVVSIDSAVAHLSGAMGKDVVIVLPRVASWRWTQQSYKWYGGSVMFRQNTPGDWTDVVGRTQLHLESVRNQV